MVNVLAIRSIPLSAMTQNAWRSAGVVFRRRDRVTVWDDQVHVPHIRAVLNMGNLTMDFDNVPVPVFNPKPLIQAVSTPSAIRRSLGDLLPSNVLDGPHWHKERGFRSEGKVFHNDVGAYCGNLQGDVQAHIDGDEFRVLSVGDKVVQATRKLGGPPNFDFEWVGVKGIEKNGIIPLVKEAIGLLELGPQAVLGWDIIVSDRPYIIEANTSPGVNDATAKRVISQIEKVL